MRFTRPGAAVTKVLSTPKRDFKFDRESAARSERVLLDSSMKGVCHFSSDSLEVWQKGEKRAPDV